MCHQNCLIYLKLLVTLAISFTWADWDYTFQRIENMNGTSGHVIFDIQTHHINRTTYGISGNITYRQPLSKYPERFFHYMRIYRSALGNNQFTLLPFRLQNASFCEFLNTNYRNYFMPSFKPPVSNMPYSEDMNVDLCEQFRSDEDKVIYVHNFTFDKSVVPMNLPSGLLKLAAFIEYNGVIDSGCSIQVTIDNYNE